MVDETLLLQRLGEIHRTLFSTLQICRACGHLSMAETERLRDALFTLSAQCRVADQGLDNAVCGPEQTRLIRTSQVLSHAALCLMSGQRDCPQWCSVDAKKLGACVETLGVMLTQLEQDSTVAPLE